MSKEKETKLIIPKISTDKIISRKLFISRLGVILNSEKFSDICFLVGKKKQKVFSNKSILSTQSSIFETMLYNSQMMESTSKEVVIEDIEPEIFLPLLQFLYGQEITINGGNVLHFLYVSKKYEVNDLVKHCVDYLISFLCMDNVLGIFMGAFAYNESTLIKKCMKMIEKETVKIFSSDTFMSLTEAPLIYILQSDFLQIPEVDLFKLVYNWCEKHQEYKPLKHIRLGIISSRELLNIVKPLNAIPIEDYVEAIEFNIDPEKFDKTLKKYQHRNQKKDSMLFSSKLFGNKISISKDRKRAQCQSSLFSIICLKPILNSGKHHWKVKVLQGDGIGIGIIRSDVNKESLTGYHLGYRIGYSFHSHGQTINEPNNLHKDYKTRYSIGDIIGVTLDLDNGEMSFSKNGIDLGVAFKGLYGNFRPAIALALSTVELL